MFVPPKTRKSRYLLQTEINMNSNKKRNKLRENTIHRITICMHGYGENAILVWEELKREAL